MGYQKKGMHPYKKGRVKYGVAKSENATSYKGAAEP